MAGVTTGSQVAFANLSDLLKGKAKEEYINEINKIRDWAATFNIVNKMETLVGDDLVSAMQRTIEKCALSNIENRLKELRDKLKKLKDLKEQMEYCDDLKPKSELDIFLISELKKALTDEITDEKIKINYSNSFVLKICENKNPKDLLILAKKEGIDPKEIVKDLITRPFLTCHDGKEGKFVSFKDSAFYSELFANEPDEPNCEEYDKKMQRAKESYKEVSRAFYLKASDYEEQIVENYYLKSGRGRRLFLNKIGHHLTNTEDTMSLINKAKDSPIKFIVTSFANSACSSIPGGILIKKPAEILVTKQLEKAERVVESKICNIFYDQDKNIPEERGTGAKENTLVKKVVLGATKINKAEDTIAKGIEHALANFTGVESKINNYIPGIAKDYAHHEFKKSLFTKLNDSIYNFITNKK